MKTTIWANCPKCQTELKIDTDETELVQIECPDCNKVFAAKVPPRSAAPVHEVFAQMPVLPPFQPAQVHYKPRRKSDESMNPAALTALIVVCASAILIPLGFGGYYVYGKLSEASQLALSNPTSSTTATTANTQPSFSNASSNAAIDATASANEMNMSVQPPAGRMTPPSSDAFNNPSNAAEPPQPDSVTFGVPELNPPMIQSEQASPEVNQAQNSPPMTTGPMTTEPMTNGRKIIPPNHMTPNQTGPNQIGPNQMAPNPSAPNQMAPNPIAPNPMTPGNGSPSQPQISVAGAGTSQSGLPVPLQRFVGPSGVLIFVLHSKGHSVASSIQELQRSLSIPEMQLEGGSDHTSVGIRYSGSVDSVAKGIRFGKVSYVDEESRSIHVQVN